MITLYGNSVSGNCHKLRLLCEQLGREYHWVETDNTRGQTHTPEFLARNPNGKMPVIELEDGRILSWMFFEQYSHEPYIAVARFIRGWTEAASPRRAELPKCLEKGNAALAVMEKHLAAHDWFSGPHYGVADIALFAYTHCAADGGFDLSRYPRVSRWLDRVFATPRFVPMPRVKPEVAARFAIVEGRFSKCVFRLRALRRYAQDERLHFYGNCDCHSRPPQGLQSRRDR